MDLEISKGSSDMSLCYRGTDVQLLGYVDSDFTRNINSRRSTAGYVFTLGSGAVTWMSWLQKIVILSTMKATYAAATKACNKQLI